MTDEGEYVSPKEAVDLIRPRHGATAVRKFCDSGLLATIYTSGGYRKIVRASIEPLNQWLAMRPGPARDAAREALIARNLGKAEMALAILDTAAVTADGTYSVRTIEHAEAQRLLAEAPEIHSGIADAPAATRLSRLLGVLVPVALEPFEQEVGQSALVLVPPARSRVTRGTLDLPGLLRAGYSLKLLTRTS